MPLASGTRLGPYEIQSQLGAGGMSEVYKAKDTRLDRFVALKFLRPELTRNTGAKQRFQREAKAASALDHPNICTIYDIGETPDGQVYLSMAYYAGETLKSKIARGPLPVTDALDIAIQVGQGLGAAHESGIIHRDIKPANILFSDRGEAKIADFGLAKLAGDVALTRVGTVQGTAVYMSPEQARGESVDRRTDIWSLGATLYEMVTGRVPFKGEHEVAVSLAITLSAPTPMNELRSGVPIELERIVSRTLQKNPDDRHQTVADLLSELRRLKRAVDTETLTATGQAPALLTTSRTTAGIPPAAGPTTASSSRPPRSIALPLAFVLVGLVTGLAVWNLKSPPVPAARPITRFSVVLPESQQLTSPGRHLLAVSPDGTRLVYVANRQLYLRSMDQLEATPIRGTEDGGRSPFFSPDGQWVGFWASNQLKKVSVGGGAPVTLCEAANPHGASWGPTDTILYGQGTNGIWQVAATGGTPEGLISMEGGQVAHGPQILPGGKAVLFTMASSTSGWNDAEIVVQSLETGQRKVLVGGTDARYVRTGHLVYASAGALVAVPFDPVRLEVTGGPVSLVDGITHSRLGTGAAHFGLSDSGTLAYLATETAGALRTLVWVARDGRETLATDARNRYIGLRVSPDGRWVGLQIRDEDGNDHIWVHDLERGSFTRQTFENPLNASPIWTPDGRALTFSTGRAGQRTLFSKPVDGSAEGEQLWPSDAAALPTSWSPNHQLLAFDQPQQPGGSRDVFVLSTQDGTPSPVAATAAMEREAAFSPDGNWIAYQSDETGQNEVYVIPYPGPGRKHVISIDGGVAPRWAPTGRELFYRTEEGNVMAASVQTEPEFEAGTPQLLFRDQGYRSADRQLAVGAWSVHPTGDRFLMIKAEGASATTQRITVVLNWLEELQRLVPSM